MENLFILTSPYHHTNYKFTTDSTTPKHQTIVCKIKHQQQFGLNWTKPQNRGLMAKTGWFGLTILNHLKNIYLFSKQLFILKPNSRILGTSLNF